jgi:glycosyltransferase involved in cell wall biosynthesis
MISNGQAPSVTIVHDYMCARAGAERVAIALVAQFPDSQFLTALYNPDGTYDAARRIRARTLPINRLPFLRHNHRLAFPLLAPSFSRVKIRTDVVICSSTGWSHGVNAIGRKIVYWHSPAKWLYSQATYRSAGSAVGGTALRLLRRRLEQWDRRSVATAHRHLCNSTAVRERLRKIYGIEAEVVFPPVELYAGRLDRPIGAPSPGFVVCVSRLLPYKNVATIVAAMHELPEMTLVVVGKGPLERDLKAVAPKNVVFLSEVSESELHWLYGNALTLVQASFEDFGLTPVEAATVGRPSVVLREGGFLDTVSEGVTGLFFDVPEPLAVAAALRKSTEVAWDPKVIRAHAGRFAPTVFGRRMHEVVSETMAAETALQAVR